MQTYAFRGNAICSRIAAIVMVAACCTLPQTSRAAAAPGTVAQRYVECARPSLRIGDAIASQGNGGYGIEVQGERYFFVYDERLTFSLLSADGRFPAAHVKVDRSSSQFSEQAQWRERWLEDIAERSGVPLIRQAPEGSIILLTVNKKALTGKSAGLSVLIDAPHQVFVQWEWDNSGNYAGPQDVAALQAATWKSLVPCLAKDTSR
jgi:hypothetical protein